MKQITLNNLNDPLTSTISKPIDTADLLSIVGNNRRYQTHLLIYYTIAKFFYMIIFTSIPFIFYTPTFYCLNSDRSSYKCNEIKACSNPFGFYTISKRISFVTKFELYCDRKYIDTMTKNFIFLIAAGGCFILTIASDFIGRKSLFVLSSLFVVLGCWMGLQENIICIVLGTSLSFLALDLYLTFTYIYTNEIVGADYRSRFLPAIQFFGSIGAIASNLISLWTISYWHIFILNLIFNGGLSVLIFYFTETPFILNKKTDKTDLVKTLTYINDINYKEDPYKREQNEKLFKSLIGQSTNPVKEIELQPVDQTPNGIIQKERTEFRKELSKSENMIKMIKVCILFLNIFVILGMTLTAAQRIGYGNVQVNIIIFHIVHIIGYIYSALNAHTIRRRRLMIAHSSLSVIISLLLIGNQKLHLFGSTLTTFIDLILCIVLEGFTGFTNSIVSTYTSELFPTAIRGFAVGAGLFVGRSSFVISNYITKMSNGYEINPMSFCFIQGLVALYCAFTLRETLNQKVMN